MLDLRIPSGLFFALTGVVLLVTSLGHPVSALTTSNVDMYTGVVSLAFGLMMLGLAWRGKKKA